MSSCNSTSIFLIEVFEMAQVYNGTSGNDTKDLGIFNRGKTWWMSGNDGDDILKSGRKDDTLYGGNGNDILDGRWGNDHLYGEAGDDDIDGSDGDDFIDGGSGNDKLRGGWGRDDIYGGSGNDSLTGNDGSDRLVGGEGNDFLKGGYREDYLIGVNPDSTNPGFGEVDILIGGGNLDSVRDYYVLGAVGGKLYYEGGQNADYAFIQGLQSYDLVTLAKPFSQGGVGTYSIGAFSENGSGLYHNGDLIAGFDKFISDDFLTSSQVNYI
jgi:Ca2+-binding RTX toxin-like protein